MAVERLEIIRHEPYASGREFANGVSYARLDGTAHYAVDASDPANGVITDLALAADTDGIVRFSGDVTLLVPAGAHARTLLLEMPNRGNRVLPRLFNLAPFELVPTDEIDPGDGFLMDRGLTLAWVGWQWDMPAGVRMGLRAPSVPDEARDPDERMQLRIQPDRAMSGFPLTDHHVGPVGNHAPIAARAGADATLLVRTHRGAEPKEIPRAAWRFAREERGALVDDPAHLWLDGGFQQGMIYDLLYMPADCRVAGAGLLAMRDLADFLRRDASSPVAGTIDHVIGEGISQCGRLLRTFLGLGLNATPRGAAYDGLLVHIAGARRGEFNMRHGQPSVQPTPAFGHLFPFADDPQTDPATGRRAGLLDRQRRAGGVPKIFYTDTSSEYWRGDASLAHMSAGDGSDVELPANVRRYLFASTQHGPGMPPLTDETAFGSRGANLINIVDYRPLYRAALANLVDWVRDGTEPPPSVYPRVSDGTAVPRRHVLDALAGIPGLTLPEPSRLPVVEPLDLGPHADDGIGRFPADIAGPAYPCLVSAADASGNETGAIRMPDVEVPVATHTGFNPRHPATGGAGQLLEYIGLTLPLPKTEAAASATGDPRPPIDRLYRDRDDYLAQVRAAARRLASARHLLAGDVELCVRMAAERWDAVAG